MAVAKYNAMQQCLERLLCGNTSKAALLKMAECVAQTKGRTVDRAAKRSKECLVCWFCECVPEYIVSSDARTSRPQISLSRGTSARTIQADEGEDEPTDDDLFRKEGSDGSEALSDEIEINRMLTRNHCIKH
jgi:hypothetical protein